MTAGRREFAVPEWSQLLAFSEEIEHGQERLIKAERRLAFLRDSDGLLWRLYLDHRRDIEAFLAGYSGPDRDRQQLLSIGEAFHEKGHAHASLATLLLDNWHDDFALVEEVERRSGRAARHERAGALMRTCVAVSGDQNAV
jgi:hypothetical protein